MITLSEKAVKEIQRLQQAEKDSQGSHLRVMIVGGGCSGMSYKLGFENTPPTADDKIIEQDGVKVIIDKKSMLYLAGTMLNFSDGLNGTGFTFENPNAKRTCGCGTSFSV
jgi:iron-sulfur cluster assembly protein